MGNIWEYYVKYCHSHITLLWLWIMLCFMSCSIMIVKCPCRVTNNKWKFIYYLSFFVILLKKNFDFMDLLCCNICHLLSDFSFRFWSFMTTFRYMIFRMQNIERFASIIGMDFIQCSFINGNTCKHIHRNPYLCYFWCPFSYHIQLYTTYMWKMEIFLCYFFELDTNV